MENIKLIDKAENLVFLLGAGASYEAKIPISNEMVNKLEVKLTGTDYSFTKHKELYNYLKGCILYSKNIKGYFHYNFNIEDLLVVISELEKYDDNIMYPFVGAWNIRLLDLAGNNFKNLTELKSLINKELSEWMNPQNGYDDAKYYDNFYRLKGEIADTLKIFSLNYDLCFERVVGDIAGAKIESGFYDKREWSYKAFEDNYITETNPDFILYKLHGSINWEKCDNKIIKKDEIVREAELIFGLPYKLTSIDPYYFYTTEFRKALLYKESKLIITIGYSFSDKYINEFITQALNQKDDLKLLVVTKCDENKVFNLKKDILNSLSLNIKKIEKIEIEYNGAKTFLENNLNTNYLGSKFTPYDDVF